MNSCDYPLSDGTSIVVVRKARKEYRCQSEPWAHDPMIRPGDLYARVKLTPGMGSGWRELTMHLECAEVPARARQPAAVHGSAAAHQCRPAWSSPATMRR